MPLIRKRWFIVSLVGLVVAITGVSLAWPRRPTDLAVEAKATTGAFAVTVTTAGELRARQFVQITVPANAQQAGAYQMRIQSLVPEGSLVKTGDVVCELDRSTLASKLSDIQLAVQKADAQMEQATLDSTLTLSQAREGIRGMELDLEGKRLAKDNAVYEAPTIRRQTEIDYERADRQLTQARADYITKTSQAQAKMREVGAEVERQRNQLRVVQDVMAGFTIRAPSPGMVIYVKEWSGRKRTVGSQVSAWDPAVATLPDLTQMESVTYVNEIDIRKIAVGQPVTISLDSDPTKHLTGRVSAVANVGEQRPNTDAKVFEVKVEVLESDTTLRPGMTTGNVIETMHLPSALSVPLEALNGNDSVAFVFKRNGTRVTRQEVATGAMNDRDVVVEHGLARGDVVLLTPPSDAEHIPLVRLPADQRPRHDSTAGRSAPPAPAPHGPPPSRTTPVPAVPPPRRG